MSQTEVKICRDCKWHTERYSDYLPYCTHPESCYDFSVATGRCLVKPCEIMRLSTEKCGPESQLWEPSLWKRIKLYFQPKSKIGDGNHE